MNIPIIKLEVEGMRHTIYTALSEHAMRLDSSIKNAVDTYCTDANIEAVVRAAAMAELDAAVKQEVRNFFAYSGNGRAAVREAVVKYLDEVYPLPLDK